MPAFGADLVHGSPINAYNATIEDEVLTSADPLSVQSIADTGAAVAHSA